MRATIRRLVVLAAAVAVVAAGPAAGAGETTVRLVPDADRVDAGGTTTVDVVVTDVDGGVGALNVTVTAGGGASITDASVGGGAGLTSVETAPDGSAVRVVAAILDTDDTGSATVATLTVEADAAGTADLAVRVTELADETGETYDVTAAEGASLTVVDESTATATAPPRTATDAPTATSTDTPTDAPASDRDGGPSPALLVGSLFAVAALAATVVWRR
jgi:hypothetical protein